MGDWQMTAIGRVRGGREVVEDDEWGPVRSRIDLDGSVLEPSAPGDWRGSPMSRWCSSSIM